MSMIKSGLRPNSKENFDIDISSSDSDSDEDLERYTAISPRIRNKIDINCRDYYTGFPGNNGFIKSYQNLVTGSSSSCINEVNLTEAEGQNSKIVPTDSDDSDEEITVIENGIQNSLEQVTNR
eukprot:CAMPEP_0205808274 /NCGR_PEP_ID=MMETSP0205-20121125/12189_1 /ASSEMBLY_ACC=CAM_ASM_000278 /TAXON_ID=36767 /ORGANISM="Euplotes focardii, Strain TN1" /LENGTH=122 /DNA_ID=CAMNT_0053083711 /DNA_START=427 /DNA_END=792 /DNA_ORIENTATION=+